MFGVLKSGKLLFVNDMLTSTYGYTIEDIPDSDSGYRLFYPDEEYRNYLRKEFSAKREMAFKLGVEAVQLDNRVTCKDGTVKVVQVSGVPVEDMLVVALIDVTERETLMSKYRRVVESARRQEWLKSEFIANMNHEVRTPLTQILGFAQLLKSDSLTPEERGQYIDNICDSGRELLDIFNKTLDYSRLTINHIEVIKNSVDLSGLMNEVENTFSRERLRMHKEAITLAMVDSVTQCKINLETDRDRLKQIFDILLDNALLYTHQGTIEIGCKPQKSEIMFFVRDTGIGISRTNLPHVFDRFWREGRIESGHTSGIGLGLPIAKALVELLGGRISIHSEEGKGTEVVFTIPGREE